MQSNQSAFVLLLAVAAIAACGRGHAQNAQKPIVAVEDWQQIQREMEQRSL